MPIRINHLLHSSAVRYGEIFHSPSAREISRLRLVKYLAISHADSCNKSYISARTFFYLSKYSLSDAHFSTGRLLFEFNRLQYTLAAPEVFASSANPVILPSGYRVSIVRNTNIDQIETTPLRYCIRLNTPTPGTASYMYTA